MGNPHQENQSRGLPLSERLPPPCGRVRRSSKKAPSVPELGIGRTPARERSEPPSGMKYTPRWQDSRLTSASTIASRGAEKTWTTRSSWEPRARDWEVSGGGSFARSGRTGGRVAGALGSSTSRPAGNTSDAAIATTSHTRVPRRATVEYDASSCSYGIGS
jgi:hypothetical protein